MLLQLLLCFSLVLKEFQLFHFTNTYDSFSNSNYHISFYYFLIPEILKFLRANTMDLFLFELRARVDKWNSFEF